MLPYIPNNLEDVAAELEKWLDGNDNFNLDAWYNEHGEYFAFKKL